MRLPKTAFLPAAKDKQIIYVVWTKTAAEKKIHLVTPDVLLRYMKQKKFLSL